MWWSEGQLLTEGEKNVAIGETCNLESLERFQSAFSEAAYVHFYHVEK